MRPELLRTTEVKRKQPFRLMTRRAIFLPIENRKRSDEMNDRTLKRRVTTPAEREALKVFRPVVAERTVTEHEKAQKAFYENRERLKALRLEREAAEKANGT
jgi:hypothetical protein